MKGQCISEWARGRALDTQSARRAWVANIRRQNDENDVLGPGELKLGFIGLHGVRADAGRRRGRSVANEQARAAEMRMAQEGVADSSGRSTERSSDNTDTHKDVPQIEMLEEIVVTAQKREEK